MIVFTTPTLSLTTLLVVPAPFILLLLTLLILISLPVIPTSLPQLKSLLPTKNTKNTKLPREFFGLPPRPDRRPSSPIPGTRDGNGFSLRAKVLLLLTVHAVVSLGCGWAWLISVQSGSSRAQALLALSITLVPATVLALACFHLIPAGFSRVSSATLVPRIVPLTLTITAIPTIIVNFVKPQTALLATSSSILGLIGLIAAHNFVRGLRTRGVIGRRRAVRKRYLLSPRPEREKSFYDAGIESDDEQEFDRGSSWITSPSHPGTLPSSSFSYSTEPSLLQTPHPSVRSETDSWITSPTVTPKSMPDWSFDSSSPQTAVTRPRSPSGRPSFASDRSEAESGYMPSVTATPHSRISTAPSTWSASEIAHARRPRSSTGSAWTASFHSAMSFGNLPAPPPLPSDVPLPPTPKSWRRKEREWDLESRPCTPKQSSDRLIAREWVSLSTHEADGLDFEWGRNTAARRIGCAAVVGLVGCWALCVPLFTMQSDSTTPVILYLLSLVLPSPILAALHFLPTTSVALPSRPSGSTLPSETTLATHRSLALVNDSQLSLPVTMSPQLTPPEHRAAPPNTPPEARWSHILAPKPSLTGFQSQTDRRSSDIWVEAGHARTDTGRLSRVIEMLKPVPALQVLPTADHRQSRIGKLREGVESWVGSLKSVPEEARRQSAEAPPRPSNVTIEISSPSKYDSARQRAQSGFTDCDYDATDASVSQAQVQTAMRARMSSSPTFLFRPKAEVSKAVIAERKVSRRESWNGKREVFEREARRKTVDLGEYELDWISATVLPGLMPDVRLGKIKVQAAPESPQGRPSTSTVSSAALPNFRPSQDFLPSMTPASRRSRGYSSSIDLSQSLDFHQAVGSTPKSVDGIRRRSHRPNASLPHIRPDGFAEDVEGHLAQIVVTDSPLRPEELARLGITMQTDASPGLDMPPFPAELHRPSPLSISHTTRGLTPVSEGDERSASSHSPAASIDDRSSQLAVTEMERMLELDSPARSEFIASGTFSEPEHSSDMLESIPSIDSRDVTRTLATKRSDSTIASTTTAASHPGTPTPQPQGIRPSKADLQLLPKPRASTRSSIVVLQDETSRATTRSMALKPTKGLRPLILADKRLSNGSGVERQLQAPLKGARFTNSKPKKMVVGIAKSPAAHPKMRWSQQEESIVSTNTSYAYQARL